MSDPTDPDFDDAADFLEEAATCLEEFFSELLGGEDEG